MIKYAGLNLSFVLINCCSKYNLEKCHYSFLSIKIISIDFHYRDNSPKKPREDILAESLLFDLEVGYRK